MDILKLLDQVEEVAVSQPRKHLWGLFYTGVNTDWFQVFLGVMLLLAVLFNNFIRHRVTGSRA